MTQARLFAAAWPPPEIVGQLTGLTRHERAGVRWSTPEQWHITLRFLGQADVDAAITALAVVRAEPCEAVLAAEPAALFRGVLAVAVTGVEALAAAVTMATAAVGVPPEDRPFRGHITLARWRHGRTPVVDGRLGGRWTVHEVALVQSTSAPGGARYDTIQRVDLGR